MVLLTPRSGKKCGKRCYKSQNRYSPAAHGAAHDEAGASPATHGGPWWSRYPSAAHGWSHTGADVCAQRTQWSHGDITTEHLFIQDLGAQWEPTLEQSVPEGLYPMERTHVGMLHEEWHSVGRIYVGKVYGELSPIGAMPFWSRERTWRGRSSKKKKCDVIITPIPSPCQSAQGGGRWVRSEDDTNKMGVEGIWVLFCYFSLSKIKSCWFYLSYFTPQVHIYIYIYTCAYIYLDELWLGKGWLCICKYWQHTLQRRVKVQEYMRNIPYGLWFHVLNLL